MPCYKKRRLSDQALAKKLDLIEMDVHTALVEGEKMFGKKKRKGFMNQRSFINF